VANRPRVPPGVRDRPASVKDRLGGDRQERTAAAPAASGARVTAMPWPRWRCAVTSTLGGWFSSEDLHGQGQALRARLELRIDDVGVTQSHTLRDAEMMARDYIELDTGCGSGVVRRGDHAPDRQWSRLPQRVAQLLKTGT
jgi:hypothetical protein